MDWPDIAEISARTSLPAGYRAERLQRTEIPALIAALKLWHPDISVGGGSCYLRESYYADKVFFDDAPNKDHLVITIKQDRQLAAMACWERECDALTLYYRLGVVGVEHRGAKLSAPMLELSESLGRAMGAGFIYGLATLKMPHAQLALERAGYQLLGIAPGYDRELVAPGVIRRVYEALYGKVLAPGEDLQRPDPRNLSPRAQALFKVLFPDEG
ncbi:MAG TPA: hypothetical protein VLC91_16110 [Spongiibacteraceae bacterium]|nr:hypothetical protein [Spongiibacteraceae bacterium]